MENSTTALMSGTSADAYSVRMRLEALRDEAVGCCEPARTHAALRYRSSRASGA